MGVKNRRKGIRYLQNSTADHCKNLSRAGKMDVKGSKDTKKRKSRNMSEKKRRDQFNTLVNDLCAMVSKNKKMDKTTVLKTAIDVIKANKEMNDKMKSHEIKEDWKPPFMTNNEFVTLMLEAIDGFLMVTTKKGTILYTSESVTPLLGFLPESLNKRSLVDILHSSDRSRVFNMMNNSKYVPTDTEFPDFKRTENQVYIECHMKCECLDEATTPVYEKVVIEGSFRKWSNGFDDDTCDVCMCCTVTLQQAQMIRELPSTDSQATKKEFTSRHSLEWKFLFLDHRGPPVIGYLPFEVLGTSGYDYVHPDDLDRLAACHEQLMQCGERKSCYYRFLTKGQQWIWLQSTSFISYHQWNSKPEFVVCKNTVVSYAEVKAKEIRNRNKEEDFLAKKPISPVPKEVHTDQVSTSSTWMDNQPETPQQPDTNTGLMKPPEVPPRKDMPAISMKTLETLKSEIVKNLVSGQKQPIKIKKSPDLRTQPNVKLPRVDTVMDTQHYDQSGDVEMPSSSSTGGQVNMEGTNSATEQQRNIPPLLPIMSTQSSQIQNSNSQTSVTSTSQVVVSSQPIILNPIQQQLHLQLLEKHQQLQAAIIRQQQELQKISNQLLLASGIANNPAVTALLQSQNVINEQLETVQLPQMGMTYLQTQSLTSSPAQTSQQPSQLQATHDPTAMIIQSTASNSQQPSPSILQVNSSPATPVQQQPQNTVQQTHPLPQSPSKPNPIQQSPGQQHSLRQQSPAGTPMHLSPYSPSITQSPMRAPYNKSSSHSSQQDTVNSASHSPAGSIQQQSYASTPQDSLQMMQQSPYSVSSSHTNPTSSATPVSLPPGYVSHVLNQQNNCDSPSTSIAMSTASPSPMGLAQTSPSPIDLMALNQDPMINSVGGQGFDLLQFAPGNQQEPADFKMFESL